MRSIALCGIVIALLLGACSPVAHSPSAGPGGGTEVGPGGDLVRREDSSAWFVSATRPIRYCLLRAESFGVDDRALRALVEEELGAWRAYLSRKKISFSRPDLRLALVPQFHGACDGSEDLRFYFGVEDDAVRDAKKFFVNPVAFPVRQSFEPGIDGAWSRGFVWIAGQRETFPARSFPDWTKPGALGAILRHELGHVLGVGHVPGTVMAENIFDYLTALPPAKLAGIDLFNELYRCEECDATATTVLTGYFADMERDPARRDDFRRLEVACALLGRPPRGDVRVTLVREYPEHPGYRVRKLFLRDDAGEVAFHESPAPAGVSRFAVHSPLFKIVTKTVTAQVETHDMEYRQYFYRGEGFAEANRFLLWLRYRTNFVEPEKHAPIQILAEKRRNWLVRELFEVLFEQYPLADLPLAP